MVLEWDLDISKYVLKWTPTLGAVLLDPFRVKVVVRETDTVEEYSVPLVYYITVKETPSHGDDARISPGGFSWKHVRVCQR